MQSKPITVTRRGQGTPISVVASLGQATGRAIRPPRWDRLRKHPVVDLIIKLSAFVGLVERVWRWAQPFLRVRTAAVTSHQA